MNYPSTTPALVSFDVYMALMDIVGTLSPVVSRELSLSGDDATGFVALWRAKQMERAASSNSMAQGHVLFSDCTAMALEYSLSSYGVDCDDRTRSALIDAWGLLNPWPEANAVIAALNDADIPVAILSNGDQAMLEATATRFNAHFDHILSAQTAGKYKPHEDVYALPEAVLGIDRSRVLHVAGSPNDVLGAIAAGMPCVWSNRKAESLVDARFKPLAIFDDLSGVPGYLKLND